MAIVKEFKALFTITDQCSKPLKDLKKSFAGFAKTAENFRKSASSLGTLTLAPLAGALTAVTASVKNSINAFLGYGTSLNDTSAKLGMTANELVALQHAADMAGASTETMNAGLSVFQKNLANAGQGKNKQLEEMMKKLGISLRDANGNMRSAANLMPELADAIARQHTQAQKAYIANTALGKAGQDLIQCMEGGAEAFKNAADEAERLGLYMKDGANVSMLDDSMKLLEKAILGVQIAIGERLAPVLAPIFTAMTDWIAVNREWMAQEMSAMIQDLAASLKEIDFKSIITGMTGFMRSSVDVFKALGGLKTVALVVATLFGAKLVSSAVTCIGAFMKMGLAFKALVPVLITGIKAVGVAFLTNPIGAAIAGICAAVGLLYAYWDDVAPYFEKVWTGVKSFFMDGFNGIKAVWDDLSGVVSALFSGDWGTLAERFSDLLGSVVSVFTNVFFAPVKLGWKIFESLFPESAEAIKGALEPLVQWFANLWQNIKSAFFDNFAAAFDGIKNAASWIGDKFSNAWNATKNFFTGSPKEQEEPERKQEENSNPWQERSTNVEPYRNPWQERSTILQSPLQQNALNPTVTTNNKLEIDVRTDQNTTAEVVNQKVDPGMKMQTVTNNGRLR